MPTNGFGTDQVRAEYFRAGNPIFNDRKLKLGTFGANVKGGMAVSSGEGTLPGDWDSALEVVKLADEMEFEAMVPVGRFRGFGGETDYGGTAFEVYTFAAAVAMQTKYSAIFATSHVPTMNPVMAAKQAATVDHVSKGRFVLNVVTGWHKTEMEMFGPAMLDHDERYDVAAEWLEIIKQLWERDDPLDYDGKYFQTRKALLKPRPLQRPRPPVMCAGQSGKGMHFAAKYCDIGFNSPKKTDSFEQMRANIDAFKQLARDEYDRDLRMWSCVNIIQGETEKEAHRLHDYYVKEKGDFFAASNMANINTSYAESDPQLRERLEDVVSGFGAYPLIGTAEQVAEGLQKFSSTGLDGIVLSWPDYHDGMKRFQEKTLPLLHQAGLR